METLRMDYRFTALLIIMFTLLTLFAKPAYPKNEYLNNGTNTCSTGSVEASIEKEDRDNDYRHYSPSNSYDNDNENYRATIRWRKNLGSACTKEFRQVQQENMELKQQLELMKMCGRVNNNPSLAQNENFRLLVSKCTGVTPVKLDNRPADGKSKWDELKDDYKKENPELTLMGDKIIVPTKSKLKIPPKDYIMPLPKPKNED
jgi:hypothetical protein